MSSILSGKPHKPTIVPTSRRYATAVEAQAYDEGYEANSRMRELPADASQAYKDGWYDCERHRLNS